MRRRLWRYVLRLSALTNGVSVETLLLMRFSRGLQRQAVGMGKLNDTLKRVSPGIVQNMRLIAAALQDVD